MSLDNLLPVHYRIEFYFGSRANTPIHSVYASSPLLSISEGNRIEPQAWENSDLPSNKMYEVIEVTHLISVIGSSHVLDSLSVVLMSVDRDN